MFITKHGDCKRALKFKNHKKEHKRSSTSPLFSTTLPLPAATGTLRQGLQRHPVEEHDTVLFFALATGRSLWQKIQNRECAKPVERKAWQPA